MLMMVMY